VADVLRAALAARPGALPHHHWKALNALTACRTPALGGHLYRCEDCRGEHFVPHSCRNRHCPACQKMQAVAWLQKQEADLLAVPYFHLVFTLPHALNALIAQNQRVLYNLLFSSASATLLKFGRERLKAQIGITAVLHTWGQNLGGHYHLHCLVTGGGIAHGQERWQGVSPRYLFPLKALSIIFRAKFRDGLKELHAGKALAFHGQLESLAGGPAFRSLLASALRENWVVYAKRPFAGPRQVLSYLSRYTHRVAIASSRILALDREAGTVSFAWKDYRDNARRKTMTLALPEFLRRFCLHILPARFVKIRNYGLLGNHQRKEKIQRARQLIAKAAPQTGANHSSRAQDAEPAATASGTPAPKCPHCGSDKLVFIERRQAWRPPAIDSS
jgi:hypothetical protein